MSSKITDSNVIVLRSEHAVDQQRMAVARREVVARARARVLPQIDPANDAGPGAE